MNPTTTIVDALKYTPKYLNNTRPGVWHMSHHIAPEVRAMFAAMVSRVPEGGIIARYKQVLVKVANACLQTHSVLGSDDSLLLSPYLQGKRLLRAEEALTRYPLPEVVRNLRFNPKTYYNAIPEGGTVHVPDHSDFEELTLVFAARTLPKEITLLDGVIGKVISAQPRNEAETHFTCDFTRAPLRKVFHCEILLVQPGKDHAGEAPGFFDEHVGMYGHASPKELTGEPWIYVEDLSPLDAYLLFESRLVHGQEASTRAIHRADWPMAQGCYHDVPEFPMDVCRDAVRVEPLDPAKIVADGEMYWLDGPVSVSEVPLREPLRTEPRVSLYEDMARQEDARFLAEIEKALGEWTDQELADTLQYRVKREGEVVTLDSMPEPGVITQDVADAMRDPNVGGSAITEIPLQKSDNISDGWYTGIPRNQPPERYGREMTREEVQRKADSGYQGASVRVDGHEIGVLTSFNPGPAPSEPVMHTLKSRPTFEVSNLMFWPENFPQRRVPHPKLKAIHEMGMRLYYAEREAAKALLADREERKRRGIADKEAFRPEQDIARWALPGTIATSAVFTSDVRERARVVDALAHSVPNARFRDLQEAYNLAMPGMSGYMHKEAVASQTQTGTGEGYFDISTCRMDGSGSFASIMFGQEQRLYALARDYQRVGRAYLPERFNNVRGTVELHPSWGCMRDWHRHRTAYWHTRIIVMDESFVLHPYYTPLSDIGRNEWLEYTHLCGQAFTQFSKAGEHYKAGLCIPFGAQMYTEADMGLRDMVYMLELRGLANGAHFEYQRQASEAYDALIFSLEDFASRLNLQPIPAKFTDTMEEVR